MRKCEKSSPCVTRRMTPEELTETQSQIEREMERRRINSMIGGIDERGNYTALHHRWPAWAPPVKTAGSSGSRRDRADL